MSQQGINGPHGNPDPDHPAETGALISANRRDIKLADINTATMATDLKDLFDRVMSGQPYDDGQVRNATNLTNTIIKVLRFEFDVYKHFVKDVPNPVGRPKGEMSIRHVAEWLRKRGDKIEKGSGPGLWKINDRACEEKDLLIRANNLREARGEKAFRLETDD